MRDNVAAVGKCNDGEPRSKGNRGSINLAIRKIDGHEIAPVVVVLSRSTNVFLSPKQ